MKLDVLAIGAHPDDVEIGAGGTLIKLIKEGKKIGILDLSKGELGTRGTIETRKSEAKAAGEILGIVLRENVGFADGFFEETEENLKALISVIRAYQPHIILANAIEDRHPDHGRASKLISRATFLSGLRKIETKREGISQKAWRPKSIYHYIQDRYLKPDFVIDITDTIDQKIESIKAFKTQFFDPESNDPETPISGEDFFDFIKSRAKEMGRPAQYRYAEGFTTERFIGVKNILDLD